MLKIRANSIVLSKNILLVTTIGRLKGLFKIFCRAFLKNA